MAFKNLIPHKSEIKQMQAEGLTLFQIVDKLKTTHNVSTSTGTLSRFFKAEAVKAELFEVTSAPDKAKSPPVKPPAPPNTDSQWLAEFKAREDQTHSAIAQLTSEVRMLNEKIKISAVIVEPSGKQKRPLLLVGVGIGIIISLMLIVIIWKVFHFEIS